jgi:hypothetical protein
MALDPVAMDFYLNFNRLNDTSIITIKRLDPQVTDPRAITPFTSGPRRLCKSFELTSKWKSEPLSPL